MIFQVTHVHSYEMCPARDNTALQTSAKWWNDMKANTGIKILGGYVSPIDHTFHITVEADDFPTLSRALGPLNVMGAGHVSPVITLDQAIPMAEEGAFRNR